MKVDQILKENQDQISISDIPFVVSGLDETRQNRLNTALQGIQASEVLKSHWNEYKTTINRSFDDSSEKLYSNEYIDYIRTDPSRRETMPEVYSELYGGNFTMAGYKKLLRMVNKIKDDEKIEPLYTNAVKLLSEIDKVAPVVAATKDNITTTQQKRDARQETENENWKKLVSNKNVKKVMDTLTKLTNDIRSESEKETISWMTLTANNVIEKVKDENPTSNKVFQNLFIPGTFDYYIATRIIKREGTYSKPEFIISKDWKKWVKKEAIQMVADMVDKFIYKNTAKLAPIVATKNNLKNIEIIDATTSRGVIEGLMKYTFKDGSGFDVKNKVVASYSKNGTFFYRFPTTFHNVVMPDGSKLQGPSEKAMNTTFIE